MEHHQRQTILACTHISVLIFQINEASIVITNYIMERAWLGRGKVSRLRGFGHDEVMVRREVGDGSVGLNGWMNEIHYKL
jgi:hypothetical protein